jgi:hypothetical protein
MTLDQQITEFIAAARRQTMAHFDERMKQLAAEISQATSADRATVVRDVRLAAEAEITKRSQEAVVAAHADVARRTQEAVAAAQADADRRTYEALATAQTESARRLDEAVAAAEAAAARRLEATVAAARAELSARADEASAAARVAALAAARTEADQRIAAAVAAASREAADTARLQADRVLVESQAAARQSELAQLDRLIDAVRRFDDARSLTDVLEALGDVAAREAPRVALFLVRGNRLAGWRAAGFVPTIDPRTLDVVSDERSLLWRAIASGMSLNTTDVPAGDRVTTPFGDLGPDAAGLAVPVRVGGETVAVIYADDAADGPRHVPSAWPEAVELVARHAARCLEVLTMRRGVAPASAPRSSQPVTRPAAPERNTPAARAEDDDSAHRYARLLVSEIKLYHEAAVTQGRQDHNLAERLRTEIDRARTLYEERVPLQIRERADFFEQELVRTLANGDPSLLGASRT